MRTSRISRTKGIEAIGEFQTLTNSYGAQFGGNGAVVNAVGQSGTNAFHGTVTDEARPHSGSLASLAPSTKDRSLAQTTLGWISKDVAKEAKPQSAPAITFSRPTASANRMIRSDTNSGCSTRTVLYVMTPGMIDFPSGSFTVFQRRHSCSW